MKCEPHLIGIESCIFSSIIKYFNLEFYVTYVNVPKIFALKIYI